MDENPSSEREQEPAGGLSANNRLGERLQAVRKQHGLSQRELARRAEVTNSTLSMIEQGKVSPSVASLEKVLAAIPMSLQEFFSDTLEIHPPIYRVSDFLAIRRDGTENLIMPIPEAGHDGVYISRQTYSPGSQISTEWMIRKGFVGGIVVQGELTLRLDGNEYLLLQGDGFHFSLHRSHSLANKSEQNCVVITVSFSDRRA